MNHLQGTAEIEAGGKMRPVKFGTNQTAIFCQVQNITISQSQEILAPEKLKDNDVQPQVLIDWCYSAFAAGARSAKQPLDFDAFEVGDWIDQRPELMNDIMSVAVGANGPNEPNRQQRRAAEKEAK